MCSHSTVALQTYGDSHTQGVIKLHQLHCHMQLQSCRWLSCQHQVHAPQAPQPVVPRKRLKTIACRATLHANWRAEAEAQLGKPTEPSSSGSSEHRSSSGGADIPRYDVRQAHTAAELRAAAYLRAVCFYKYPEGRSEYAARSHRRMKADAEWDAVTAKFEGRDPAYEGVQVTCHVAALPDGELARASSALEASSSRSSRSSSSSSSSADGTSSLLAALRSDLDASAKLPADPARGRLHPQLVIGSLDLNIGAVLPAEELIGRLPKDEPQLRRAYLSNVCVAPSARRMGVANALIQHAEHLACQRGVEYMYVHVVADNTPARELYCGRCGFEVEAEESESYARSLQRPRRMLLAKRLVA